MFPGSTRRTGTPPRPSRGGRRLPSWRPSLPSLTLSTGNKIRLALVALVVGVVVFSLTSSALWMRWWWFGSVGYRDVLVDRALHQVATFVLFTAAALAIILGSGLLALRRTRSTTIATGVARIAHRALFYAVVLASTVVAILVGLTALGRWELYALALNGESYGRDDPVFGRDISFYLFTYPAITAIWNLLFVTVVVATIVTVLVYVLRMGLSLRRLTELRGTVVRHVSTLAGVLFLLGGLRLILNNFDLVYSSRGIAFGASYTDLYAVRPANWIGGVSLLLLALLCMASRRVPARRELIVVGATALFLSLGVRAILPAIVQETIVSPDEIGKERPYVSNNIAMTRGGFGLDAVVEGELSGASGVSSQDVASSPTLVDNVRLWDYRVAQETYQQLQTFASYYVFRDVDVDRYVIDGETVQVILAAREIDQAGLPGNARTWSNRRLVYTHGYGAVVSPVDEATRSGLPTFFVENVPPSGEGSLGITRPEIYFGESSLDWVVVGSKVPEFTALPGVDQTLSVFAGEMRGAIALDDRATRIIAALDMRDRNLLLSGNITDDSALVPHRNIVERVEMIAPFLAYDDDPYLVIADGRLIWVMDAYTSSDRFPHASREAGLNYIRASAKVTIDAATGETIFYRTAEPDPIADAYGEIYDGLFTPIAAAPLSVSSHFRYPELLYERQTEVYAAVHVDDPDDYYNGEDRWAVPAALASAQTPAEGQDARVSMPAYYMTLPLPGEASPDFSMVRPFIRSGDPTRQTMSGWMAGRSDVAGRLSLNVYAFPRQTSVLSPAQVEGRINQEPTISRELTLWGQSGSEVIFGNLLVLPIKDTVIYIQPLYLRATGGSGIPELTRVIVATRDEVVIAETLGAAFAQLTGSDDGAPPVDTPVEPAPEQGDAAPASIADAVARANDAYERGQDALAASDWTAYGEAQVELAAALEELGRLTATGDATPISGATPVASP